MKITLPNIKIRDYQLPAWEYLMSDTPRKRAVLCWARRLGKDTLCMHYMAVASQQKVATYWYMGPTTTLAREAFWDATSPHTGQRRIFEAFIGMHDPSKNLYGLIANKNENEMTLDLINGSRIRFCGSDNYHNLLGSPPYGLVFSEFARADPQSWNVLRPILAENSGWAAFNSTPVGENFFATLYRNAITRERWFAQLIPASATNVFTPEVLKEELEELIESNGEDYGRAIYEQEYACSFAAGGIGAYFAREIQRLEEADQITNVPYDPRIPVLVSVDLGYADMTSIWFYQLVGKEVRVIDYLENSNVGLDWYAAEMKKKPYAYSQYLFPADVAVHELGSGRSRVETLRSLGINPHIVAAQSKMDQINSARTLLPSCWFDKTKCKKGLDALRQYRRKWDDKRKVYADTPLHDWCSHAADAFMVFATSGVKPYVKTVMKRRRQGFV